MHGSFVLLPGDGIGPEIVNEARKTLEAVAVRGSHTFSFAEYPMGGVAIDLYGDPLPTSTLEACRAADAIILGAVGGPKWDDPDARVRPETGLLTIRRELDLFANLRPIRSYPVLLDASPLKRRVVEGVDILFCRELTGGIYFGPSELSKDGTRSASTMAYTSQEIERIVRLAARAAQSRRNKLTSVDKANVLEVSRHWRRTAARVMAEEFPEVEYDVVLVDAMAMHLISNPRTYDVVVTGNMFGDILTDEASVLPGSLGMLPSASLGTNGPGLFEPVHGTAPDIAGQGIANPLATILSAAMALRHCLALDEEASIVERAVETVLDSGLRTADIAINTNPVSTAAMGDAVARAIAT